LCLVPLSDVGTQLGFGKLTDAATQELLLVGQSDVHTDEIVSFGMRLTRSLLATAIILAIASPALADATVFLGATTTAATRADKGFAVGAGFLFVGFEFEYAGVSEDVVESAPSLRTGMGNVLLQTPTIHGFQPYFTTGVGGYREELGPISETHVGFNNGGGVKISLVGPLRARVDYRVFTLKGDPLFPTFHRFYGGLNIKF
jgi:hypothetical protein